MFPTSLNLFSKWCFTINAFIFQASHQTNMSVWGQHDIIDATAALTAYRGDGKKKYLLHPDLLSKRLLQCYIQHVISTPAFRWQQSIFTVQTPSLRSNNSQINREAVTANIISVPDLSRTPIFFEHGPNHFSEREMWNIKTEFSFGLFSSGAKFLY